MWKSRHKKKPLEKITIFFLPGVIIMAVLVLFFFIKSGFFNINQIEITGKLSCAQDNQLKDETGTSGQNFFFLNTPKILDNLKKKFLCIKSVTLTKSLPNKIHLQVTNRQALAALINLKEKEASLSSLIENTATPEASAIDEVFVVDNEGVVFASKTDNLNLAKVYLSGVKASLGDKFTNNNLSNALQILEKVKALGVNIQRNWVYNNDLLISQAGLGPKIIFNLDNKINTQLASLQLILTEAKINSGELEFIDLRFDKPVVKIAPKTWLKIESFAE